MVAAPQRREYVVELDADGREGQEAANDHVDRQRAVDGQRRYLAANVLRATRRLERAGHVLAENTSDSVYYYIQLSVHSKYIYICNSILLEKETRTYTVNG